MRVQRVVVPLTQRVAWLVLDAAGRPVGPIHDFLHALDHLGRSPATLRAYAYHLSHFWEFVTLNQRDWRALTLTDFTDFVGWLRRSINLSPSSINTTLSAVTSWYAFHAALGTVSPLPPFQQRQRGRRAYKGLLYHLTKRAPAIGRVLSVPAPQPRPVVLTPAQVQQCLAACRHLRDRFLIALLYETGMRIGQALGLQHADVHSWDNEILITPRPDNRNGARAKTYTPYVVHVSPALMQQYATYLVDEFYPCDSPFVFINRWGGTINIPLAYSTVHAFFHALSQQVGFHVHPHLFRHTHATDLLRAGWDPAFIQRRLGHASVQTTINTYVHITDADLKRQYQHYCTRQEQPS